MNTCLKHQQQYPVYCPYCGIPAATTTNTSTGTFWGHKIESKNEISLDIKYGPTRELDVCTLVVNGIKTNVQPEVLAGLYGFIKELSEKKSQK